MRNMRYTGRRRRRLKGKKRKIRPKRTGIKTFTKASRTPFQLGAFVVIRLKMEGIGSRVASKISRKKWK